MSTAAAGPGVIRPPDTAHDCGGRPRHGELSMSDFMSNITLGSHRLRRSVCMPPQISLNASEARGCAVPLHIQCKATRLPKRGQCFSCGQLKRTYCHSGPQGSGAVPAICSRAASASVHVADNRPADGGHSHPDLAVRRRQGQGTVRRLQPRLRAQPRSRHVILSLATSSNHSHLMRSEHVWLQFRCTS